MLSLILVERVLSAAAEAACTNVTSCSTISSSGEKCLTNDLSSAAADCIIINADNVVFDLGGHIITTSSPSSRAITNLNNHANIVIKNGSLNLAGTRGIELFGNNHMVDNIRVNGNSNAYAIVVNGSRAIIKNCQVLNSRYGILVGSEGGASEVSAIITHNEILDTISTGIQVYDQTAAIIENNRISNTSLMGTAGIFINGGSNGLVVENRILNFATGLSDASDSGKYRDNTTMGCTTPFTVGSGFISLGIND